MCRRTLILGFCIFFVAATFFPVRAEVTPEQVEFLIHKVLGTESCATSGCHGGAGPVRGAVTTFNREDPHAHSYDTLATPRSARMGEALRIADVRTSASCTVCHAPAASVPEGLRGEDLRIEDGVGCASCHDSAVSWLLTHTRPELDHSAKVAAGMRDLRSPYARANACVACHQVIEPRLVETGRHPRLIFELDGQLAAEPAHWREVHGWDGAKAWLVGQAVAWREAAAARADGRDTMAGAAEREAALAWLVGRAGGAGVAGSVADAVARRVDTDWPAGEGEAVLRRLAGVGGDFRAAGVSRLEQAYRAERLVLGLDRVFAAWPERARATAAEPVLARLFKAAQSVPDFEPAGFAKLLDELARTIGGAG
jgi:hypothetical protein